MEACLLKGNPANAWLAWARVKLTDAGELCHPKLVRATEAGVIHVGIIEPVMWTVLWWRSRLLCEYHFV